MSHPDISSDAIEVITKYNIISKFPAYTFSNIDNESYENIQYILLCMRYESSAQEFASKRADFVQGNMT